MTYPIDRDKGGNALYRCLPSREIPTLVRIEGETVANIGGTVKRQHFEATCLICGLLSISIEARSQGWQSLGDARDIAVQHMAAHLVTLSNDLKDTLR